tara:strand:+ start:6283 stop:7086 length:804 start_codon:yes stop_codon:yes gene_type:complete
MDTSCVGALSVGGGFDDFVMMDSANEEQEPKYYERMETYHYGKGLFDAGVYKEALSFLKKVAESRVLSTANTTEGNKALFDAQVMLLKMRFDGFEDGSERVSLLAREVIVEGESKTLSAELKVIFAKKKSHGNPYCQDLLFKEIEKELPEIVTWVKAVLKKSGIGWIGTTFLTLGQRFIVAQLMKFVKEDYAKSTSQAGFFEALYNRIDFMNEAPLSTRKRASCSKERLQEHELFVKLYTYAASKLEEGRRVYCKTHFCESEPPKVG